MAQKKSAKIANPKIAVDQAARMQDQIDNLKDNLAVLTETVQCLPCNEPVSIPDDSGGGGFPGEPIAFGGKQLEGVGLVTCRSYRVWRNRTGAAKDRTVDVRPVGKSFPNGSTITVFTGADNLEGQPPPAGAPSVTVGSAGDAVGISVPVNQAVFVHYQAARPRGANSIRAKISQSV